MKIINTAYNALSEEAKFNIPSYTDCFLAENILRKYIEYHNVQLSQSALNDAKKWLTAEQKNKGRANISFDIRRYNSDLYYLSMDLLASEIDVNKDSNVPSLNRSAKVYKPIRDAVGHTSIITSPANQLLNTEYENIKSRIKELLKSTKI